jgi:O-antigen/teichoic acid export membrane protein
MNCLAAAVCVGAYVFWGQGASLALAFVTMALTVATSLMALTGAVLRGAGALVLGQALATALRPMVQSALLCVAILSLADFTTTAALSIACISALAIVPAGLGRIAPLWRRGGPQPVQGGDERRVWRRSCAVMSLTTIVRTAEAALPLLFIGALSSMKEAGLYRVASSAMVITNMAETMMTIMVPAMTVRFYEGANMARLQKLAAASCVVMVLPTMSITLLLWSFGGPLLGFAFGADFAPASMALTVLATGALVSALGGISTALLHAARREFVVTRAFALSLIVSAGGSLLLAPHSGASGVAVAVLGGVVLRTAWLAYACRHLVGVDPTFVGAIKTFVAKSN